MAAKIGLFFGSSTGAGEGVAYIIKKIVEEAELGEVDIQVVSADNVKIWEAHSFNGSHFQRFLIK